MAQTAGGTYYAASSELVSSWPATSLDLANQLESRFAAKADLSGATFTGTISSSSQIGVYSNSIQTAIGVGLYADNANARIVNLDKGRGSESSPSVVQNNDLLGTIQWRGYSATASAFVNSAQIRAEVDGTPDSSGDSSDMPGRLLLLTSADGSGTPTERMRISSDGTVTFANVYAKTVGATNRDLYIDSTGVIGYVSSIRASKTEIAPQTDPSWLMDLNPVTFRYRAKNEEGTYTDTPDGPVQYGLIAEEVEAVNPEVVFYDETDSGPELRGVAYSALITPLLALVQQQQAQIHALTARLDAAGV